MQYNRVSESKTGVSSSISVRFTYMYTCVYVYMQERCDSVFNVPYKSKLAYKNNFFITHAILIHVLTKFLYKANKNPSQMVTLVGPNRGTVP